MAKLHPIERKHHPCRVSNYKPFRNELLGCDTFMPLESIDQFKISNNLAINVYELDDDERVVPLRISEILNACHIIDLLLIKDDERRHYCLIKDLEKLLKHVNSNDSAFVKLPKYINDKQACVDVQCNDGKSFKWCVLAAKYGKTLDHPERIDNYFTHAAEIEGYHYPMKTQSITHFK